MRGLTSERALARYDGLRSPIWAEVVSVGGLPLGGRDGGPTTSAAVVRVSNHDEFA